MMHPSPIRSARPASPFAPALLALLVVAAGCAPDEVEPPYAPHEVDVESVGTALNEGAPTPDEVLAQASRHIGYREDGSEVTPWGSRWGYPTGEWCGMFVMSMVEDAGGSVGPNGTIPRTEYTPNGVASFKARGEWFDTPKKGDIIYFNWQDGGDSIDHVGIVADPSGWPTSVVTIEGNSGEAVVKTTRYNNGIIAGFGRPRYRQPAPPQRAKLFEVLTGDFDGDGKTDLATVSQNANGGWSDWLALEFSNGGSGLWQARTPRHMRNGGKDSIYQTLTGDFNGDGKTDLATISQAGGGGWRDWVGMEISTGTGFASGVWRASTPLHMRNGGALSDYRVFAVDVNGDKKTDIVTIGVNAAGGWADWAAVELSTGTGFTSQVWPLRLPKHIRNGGFGRYEVLPGDFNGDGRIDLAAFGGGAGGWKDWYAVALSTGTGFVSAEWPSTTPQHVRNGGVGGYRFLVGDYNGDGKSDIATVSPLGSGGWKDWISVDLSTGAGFSSGLWPAATPTHMRNGGALADYRVVAADLNGDGRTDLVTVSPNGGGGWASWYAVELSSGTGFRSTMWATPTPGHMRNGGSGATYRVLVGDSDGNRRADLITISANAAGGWRDWFAVDSSSGASFATGIRRAATPLHMRNGGQ